MTRLDNITKIPDVQIPKVSVRYSESEFEILVGRYLDALPKEKATPPQFQDLDDFFELVQNAIVSRQNS